MGRKIGWILVRMRSLPLLPLIVKEKWFTREKKLSRIFIFFVFLDCRKFTRVAYHGCGIDDTVDFVNIVNSRFLFDNLEKEKSNRKKPRPQINARDTPRRISWISVRQCARIEVKI